MQLSPIGLTLDDLDTPALLLDLDAFEHNVGTMSETIRGSGKHWRPHGKAFKNPAIAHALLRAGAIGVTVAKVSEAEVMAAGGITDILIAHLVVGPSKAARLAALQRQADVKATVDHVEQLPALSAAARTAGTTIGLLVDVDLGMGRTGVGSAEDAVALARRIAESPGLRLDGVMGYEGHTLMIPDPVEKRREIERAIDSPERGGGRRGGGRPALSDRLGRRHGVVPVHGRTAWTDRTPGRWRHLRVPLLHGDLWRSEPPAGPRRAGDHCQPSQGGSGDPGRRQEVAERSQGRPDSHRLPVVPGPGPFRRARDH